MTNEDTEARQETIEAVCECGHPERYHWHDDEAERGYCDGCECASFQARPSASTVETAHGPDEHEWSPWTDWRVNRDLAGWKWTRSRSCPCGRHQITDSYSTDKPVDPTPVEPPQEEFPPVEAGEWIRPPLGEPYRMKCCGCGLIHTLLFALDTDGKPMFAAWRLDDVEETVEPETLFDELAHWRDPAHAYCRDTIANLMAEGKVRPFKPVEAAVPESPAPQGGRKAQTLTDAYFDTDRAPSPAPIEDEASNVRKEVYNWSGAHSWPARRRSLERYERAISLAAEARVRASRQPMIDELNSIIHNEIANREEAEANAERMKAALEEWESRFSCGGSGQIEKPYKCNEGAFCDGSCPSTVKARCPGCPSCQPASTPLPDPKDVRDE